MHLKWAIASVTALLAAGGAAAQVAAAGPVALPMPLEAKISVPRPAPLNLLPDRVKTIDISQTLRFQEAHEGLLADLKAPAPSLAPARSAAVPLTLIAPHASVAALSWDLSKWGSLGLTAEHASGISTMLGDFTPRPLLLTDETRNSAGELSAHVAMGDGWVTSFSYNAEISQLDLKAGASSTLATASAHGQSYGLSIAKHGLFGDAGTLGISVSRPSENYFGSVSLAGAGLDGRINLLQQNPGAAFANGAKETDIALGYVTTFFNGALALQANAGYQMNVGGQSGANSVTVLSRAKINF